MKLPEQLPEQSDAHVAQASSFKLAYLVIAVIFFGLGIMATVLTLGLLQRIQPAPMVIMPPPTAVPTATPGPVRVYINGEVNQPAVYSLPPDAIVQDLLEEAGGFTPDAQRDVVNLALPLQDGLQIYVPHQDEDVLPAELMVGRDSAPASPSPIVVNSANTAVGAENNPTNDNDSERININTADSVTLETLPGIGPSTAAKIIAHRDENGLFATIEDLMDVSGIGPAKFAQVEPLITVDGR